MDSTARLRFGFMDKITECQTCDVIPIGSLSCGPISDTTFYTEYAPKGSEGMFPRGARKLPYTRLTGFAMVGAAIDNIDRLKDGGRHALLSAPKRNAFDSHHRLISSALTKYG